MVFSENFIQQMQRELETWRVDAEEYLADLRHRIHSRYY